MHASSQEATPQAATEPSQISAELMKKMESSITEALRAEKVAVQDVYGDGRHVSIEVVSEEFEGQSSVKRQRLVYKVHHPSINSHICFVSCICLCSPIGLPRELLSSVNTEEAASCACRQSGRSCKTQCMLWMPWSPERLQRSPADPSTARLSKKCATDQSCLGSCQRVKSKQYFAQAISARKWELHT